MVLTPGRPDQSSRHRFQALFEERPIVEHQQPLRHVHPTIRVDADQVVVEGGVVDFRERECLPS